MTDAYSWLSMLLATDAPALPATWAMRLYLTLGWALVLSVLVVALGGRLSLPARRWLAAAITVWTLLPGPMSPDYWLGLAFHAPSLTAMLVCGVWLWRALIPGGSAARVFERAWTGSVWWLLFASLALGYVLLLDTFAVWSQPIYAWGFSPALLLGLLALASLPWVLGSNRSGKAGSQVWIAPVALLLFAATRLPTGNLWDALLDPWLWLVLQGALVRGLYRKWRG
jgi:hypothetical protein